MRARHVAILFLLAVALTAEPRAATAADVDAVVRAPKPITVKLGAGTIAVEKKVAVDVANAASDPAGATFRLVVGDGDCPPGLVSGSPDFGKKNAGAPDTIKLLPGKHGKATVRLTVTALAFTTVAPKVPARCSLVLSVSVSAPAGAVDPSPANATAPLPLDVLDANDPAPPTLAEIVLTNAKPLRLTATPGKVVTKTVKVAAANSSSGTGLGTPDADLALTTIDGDCPNGVSTGADFDKAPGVQSSVRVRAGKKANGKLTLAVDASTFPPGTKASPARCVLTLAAEAAANTDVSNDVARLVLDVIGGTGTPPVPNLPPTASFTVGTTGATFTPVTFDGADSSDPEGDPLTFHWSFGDGSVGAIGALAHAYAQAGTFTVRLTVADGHGGTAFVEHDVTIGAGAVAQGTVPAAGVVRNLGGALLAGVEVIATGGGSGTTDAAGTVTLSVPRGIPFTFTLTKSGFSTQYLPFVVPAGAEGTIFEATMVAQEAAKTVNATTGGTVAGKDGATLILPPNGLVGANGASVTGAVSVAITPVDPVSAPASFPGRYAGFDATGQEGLLLSHGTVEFVLTKNGAPVNLAPGATATIEIPLYATLAKGGGALVPGAVIPLWSLDERTGGWVQEGTGVVVASSGAPSGLALRATVGHLSWWNCDAFEFPPYKPKPKCMVDTNADGILEDLTGTGHCWNAGTGPEQPPPLPGSPLRLPGTGPAAVAPRIPAYAAQAAIPAAGGVVLPVPANLDITIRASAKNGTLVGTKVLHGGPDVEEEVQILLKPLAFEDAVPITIPWNQTYTMAVGAVHQYRFDATAGDQIYVTLSRAGVSALQGGFIVQGPDDYELGPKTFGPANGKLAFFAPTTGRYRIVIDGTAGEPASYRLQVDPTGTVPLLLSTSPVDGATGVALGAAVSATFSTAIDPTTVTASDPSPTFRVFGPIGGIPGVATANGATATFTPTSPLDPGVPYLAKLTTGIRSSAGDALTMNYEWGFTSAGDSGSLTPIGVGDEPDLAIGPTGQAFVVYHQDYPSGARGTSIGRFVPGAGWKPPVLLRSEQSSEPDLAVSADGSAVAVWRTGSGASAAIFASRYSPADGWSAAEILDPANANLAQAFPNVAMDDDGNAIAIWRYGLTIRTRRYTPADGWSALDTLFPTANQPVFESAHLAVAPPGRAVVARIQGDDVVVRRYDPTTGWEDAEPFLEPGSYSVVRTGIDAAGNVLVIRKSGSAWSWRRYDAATDTWNSTQILLTDSTPNFLGALYDAQLLVMPNGDAITASQQSDAPGRIWTARFDGAQKTWTVPETLVSTSTSCSFMLASNAAGDVAYAAWLTCTSPPAAIAWKKYTSAAGWDAVETPIPAQNSLDAAGVPPFVHVAVAPDDTALLVFGRNHNVDDAILAARLE